jgi:hypothetical protein
MGHPQWEQCTQRSLKAGHPPPAGRSLRSGHPPARKVGAGERQGDMTQVDLFPWWLILIFAVWAAVGPLVGIVIGHYLTRSWQRRQWIADNRKEEYRKVLSGLNRLNTLLVKQHLNGRVDVEEIKPAMDEVSVALNTSLFITDFLEESKVAGDVLDYAKKLVQGGSFEDYQANYWKAIHQIIASAKKHTQ